MLTMIHFTFLCKFTENVKDNFKDMDTAADRVYDVRKLICSSIYQILYYMFSEFYSGSPWSAD